MDLKCRIRCIAVLADKLGAVGLGRAGGRAGDPGGTLPEFRHMEAAVYPLRKHVAQLRLQRAVVRFRLRLPRIDHPVVQVADRDIAHRSAPPG